MMIAFEQYKYMAGLKLLFRLDGKARKSKKGEAQGKMLVLEMKCQLKIVKKQKKEEKIWEIT